ncbi:hypothetical protein HPB47_027356 [Ixodes persulcatus]|uniref:Uncharacterized protein n=1 Tax=Ixodes persulcatus TaxID=34615 RepID=A0AC60PY50_IXOPE|nr:hypothetical protein HPB47_027356 [Ixodes persulcatus]
MAAAIVARLCGFHFVEGELPALRRALSLAEAESTPYGLVILSDSKAALTQLANLERALPLTGELANAAIMLQR